MGEITIDGIIVDTEDIDLLVRHKPLADLDILVKGDKQILSGMSTDDKLRPYWEHRLETHRIACDIVEWQVANDIPTVDLPKKTRDRTQGLYALEKCRELEERLSSIEAYLKRKTSTPKRNTNRYNKYI